MGYTHYFETLSTPSQDVWNKVVEEAKEVSLASSALIQFESDMEAIPLMDSRIIRFNGVGDEGYETFLVEREGSGWSFCKTARKPYDEIVVAILIIAKHHLVENFRWTSDGEGGDFNNAVSLLKKSGFDYPLNVEGEGGDEAY